MSNVSRQTTERPNFITDGGRLVRNGLPTVPNTAAGFSIEKRSTEWIRERYKLTNVSIAVTAANDFGGVKIGDMPNTAYLLLGVIVDLTVTGTGGVDTLADIDMAVGTAVAAASPLATTALDVVPKIDSTAGGVVDGATTDTEDSQFFAASASNDLFLNVSVVIGTDGTVVCNGFIDLVYVDLGKAS